MKLKVLITSLILSISLTTFAAELDLGSLLLDRPAVDMLGFELEITGSLSYAATATVEYKEVGQGTWLLAPDFIRVRKDLGLGTNITRNEAFAGSIWNLTPGKTYDVRVTVTEPGVGTKVLTKTAITRALATETKSRAATHVIQGNMSQFQIRTILNDANPGDIIEVRGEHVIGTINIINSGTKAQPIYLRGDGTGAFRNATGARIFSLYGSHWVIEDLSFYSNFGSKTQTIGVRGCTLTSSNCQYGPAENITLRRNTIVGRKGFTASDNETSSENYDITIYDNIFKGKWSWDDIVKLSDGIPSNDGTELRSTWDDTGIKMSGQGHSIFNNTLSGYGDSFKTDRKTHVDNVSISYSRNKVLWGGDDGIELDDAFRNVVAVENYIANTATGGSKQPQKSLGGPNYFVKNLFLNQFLRPFKLNDSPNGVIIVHNTIVGTVDSKPAIQNYLYLQYRTTLKNVHILNNLWVHKNLGNAEGLLWFDGFNASACSMDGDAFYPDGKINIGKTASNLAEARNLVTKIKGINGASFESQGIALSSQPFSKGINKFGSNWKTFVNDFDPRLNSSTPAKDTGLQMNGYNAVSRGAINLGDLVPKYGARVPSATDSVAPMSPSGLSVQ